MSCGVHWCEDGTVEYCPCMSGYMAAEGEALSPACEVCTQDPGSCKEDCPEAQWLFAAIPDNITGPYIVHPENGDGESYSEDEVLEMLDDDGIDPYGRMYDLLVAAIKTVLKEHPEARLKIPSPDCM